MKSFPILSLIISIIQKLLFSWMIMTRGTATSSDTSTIRRLLLKQLTKKGFNNDKDDGDISNTQRADSRNERNERNERASAYYIFKDLLEDGLYLFTVSTVLHHIYDKVNRSGVRQYCLIVRTTSTSRRFICCVYNKIADLERVPNSKLWQRISRNEFHEKFDTNQTKSLLGLRGVF